MFKLSQNEEYFDEITRRAQDKKLAVPDAKKTQLQHVVIIQL